MSIAFFDIDGTLFAKPSLERRFFRGLRYCGKIPARNYLGWIARTIRLGLRDVRLAYETNKIYLRGLSAETFPATACYGGMAIPGAKLPKFFPAAIERVSAHALCGDRIVLVSGTLAPLAEIVKFALERELLQSSVAAKVHVLATELEQVNGRWTGQVAGAPMFGETKALAIKEFAHARAVRLAECSAYGDSSLDRWMLSSVGHPLAVNPTPRLRRIARLYGWQMLVWRHPAVRAGRQAMKWTV